MQLFYVALVQHNCHYYWSLFDVFPCAYINNDEIITSIYYESVSVRVSLDTTWPDSTSTRAVPLFLHTKKCLTLWFYQYSLITKFCRFCCRVQLRYELFLAVQFLITNCIKYNWIIVQELMCPWILDFHWIHKNWILINHYNTNRFLSL